MTKQMRVLVACESSGVVRDAFLARGHDAISCDLKPTESPGPHHQGDVFEYLAGADAFDLVIAHPPCTYLSNAGVHLLMSPDGMIREDPGSRWQKMLDAVEFFNRFKGTAPKVCIENPKPHGYASHRMGLCQQVVDPSMFGHDFRKRTHLWLEGLPFLMATSVYPAPRSFVASVPPGPDQATVRSRTASGLAFAMANQWG